MDGIISPDSILLIDDLFTEAFAANVSIVICFFNLRLRRLIFIHDTTLFILYKVVSILINLLYMHSNTYLVAYVQQVTNVGIFFLNVKICNYICAICTKIMLITDNYYHFSLFFLRSFLPLLITSSGTNPPSIKDFPIQIKFRVG